MFKVTVARKIGVCPRFVKLCEPFEIPSGGRIGGIERVCRAEVLHRVLVPALFLEQQAHEVVRHRAVRALKHGGSEQRLASLKLALVDHVLRLRDQIKQFFIHSLILVCRSF